MKAFSHYDGEEQLLRIIDDNGDEWDEDLADWVLTLELKTGRLFWRHRRDGRKIRWRLRCLTNPVPGPR